MPGTHLLIAAAGDSRRMGRPKALLELDGRPVWEHVLLTARDAGCNSATLLCSNTLRDQLPEEHPELRFAIVPEALRAKGPIGSLVHGLATLPTDCNGALIWPVDHPFVRRETVLRLLEASGRVRQPVLEGRGGHPIWVESALLRTLPEHLERGTLRDLIASVPIGERERVEVQDFGVRFNCNEAADWDSGCVRWHQGE